MLIWYRLHVSNQAKLPCVLFLEVTTFNSWTYMTRMFDKHRRKIRIRRHSDDHFVIKPVHTGQSRCNSNLWYAVHISQINLYSLQPYSTSTPAICNLLFYFELFHSELCHSVDSIKCPNFGRSYFAELRVA